MSENNQKISPKVLVGAGFEKISGDHQTASIGSRIEVGGGFQIPVNVRYSFISAFMMSQSKFEKGLFPDYAPDSLSSLSRFQIQSGFQINFEQVSLSPVLGAGWSKLGRNLGVGLYLGLEGCLGKGFLCARSYWSYDLLGYRPDPEKIEKSDLPEKEKLLFENYPHYYAGSTTSVGAMVFADLARIFDE